MSLYTVAAIAVITIAVIIYQIIKRLTLNSLMKALQNKNYEQAIQMSKKPLANKLLTEYMCDLFRIRAYIGMNDEQKFKNELMNDLEKHYPLEKRKEILEQYFHYFIIKKDKEYAEKLLDKIKELNDSKYLKYNEQAYEVIFNKRCDLLKKMDDEIETDGYYGFPLGVVVYMIAIQYLYLGDKENARKYFYNSLTCFHPKSIYVPQINKYVDYLTKELGKEDLDY